MPTVSVVVPTYDRADVLARAVESVLAQTVEDLELLVVDDGSTDATPEVLDSFADPRLRVITHETNRGANVARNTGIEHAESKYVAFLDSDDEWHPRKLERQLSRLKTAPDDFVAAYCGFEQSATGLRGRVLSGVAALLSRADDDRPEEGGEELIGEILADRLHSGAGSTLLVETAVARRVGGFDEALDRFQDPEFLLRVVQEGKLAYVDRPLVVRHETANPSADAIRRADEQFLETHADLVARAQSEGYRVRAAHELVLAKRYLEEGAYERAAEHLADARLPPRHWPGVLWSAGTGLRRRWRGRTSALLASAVAAGLLVGTYWLGRAAE